MVEEHVRRTQGYLRSYDIVRAVITLVVFVLGYLMALAVVDNWLWPGGLGRGGRTLAWLALVGLAGVYFWRAIWPHLFRRINPVYAADRLEHAQPSLMNSLVNFLLLRSEERQISPAVMHGLERQAAAGIAHLPAEAAVDRRPVLRVAYVLVGLISIAALFVVLSPKSPLTAAARILFPWADIAPATRVRIDTVEPGSHDVFRGEPVTVTATIRGLRDDDTVTLRYASVDGQSVNQSVAMVRPEGEAAYRCQLPPDAAGMQRDLVYQVEAGDAKSNDFVLHVVPAPTIQIENIEYRYPGYTRMDPLVVERQGDIKALEGTQVVIRANASQPIGTASLILSGSRDTTLAMQARELSARGELTLKIVRRDGGLALEYEGYKLVVTNARGESNPQPPSYRIEVIPDLPPQVDIYEPKQRDVKLPADEELSIEMRARDADFALSDVRLTATRNGKRLLDESLVKGKNLRLDQPVRPGYRFAPAQLGLQPGDEVLWRVTAIDNKLPQPNRQQTPQYRIEIVGPSGEELAQNDPRQRNSEKGEQADQGATGTKGQEGAKGEQGSAEDKGGQKQDGAEGAKGEKGSETKGGMNEAGEKSQGEQGPGTKGESGTDGNQSEGGEKVATGQEPSDAAPRDPLDDGQAVQEIVKHLEQKGKKPDQGEEGGQKQDSQMASAENQQQQRQDGKGQDNGQQNQQQKGQQQQNKPQEGGSQNQSGAEPQGGGQKDGQKQQDQQKNGLKPQPDQQQGGAQQGGGGRGSDQQDGKQEGAQENSGQSGASGNHHGSSTGDSKTAEGMSGSKQDGSQQSGSNQSGNGDKKGDQPGQPGNNQASKSDGDQEGTKQPGQRAGETNAQQQPGQSQGDQQASAGENQQGMGSQQSPKKDSPAAGSQQKPGHDLQRGTQQQNGEKSPAAQKQNPGTKPDGAQKAGDQVASNEPKQNQSGERSADAKPGENKSADQKAGEKPDATKPPGLKPGERDPQSRPEQQPDASSGGKPQSGGPQGREQKDGNSSEGNRPNDEAKDLTQKSGESTDNRNSGQSNDKPQEKTRAPGKTPSKGEQAPSDSQSNEEDSKNPEKQRPSDTSSDQSGERAGKGPEGMGQQSSGAGGGSAGKNQAADDGGSRSQQSGPGDQGNQAGNQLQTDRKTGQAGTKPGDARQGRPEDSQQANAGDRQGEKTEPTEPKPDAQPGKHPGEGQPTGGESAEPSSGSGGDPGASGRSGPSNTKPTGEVVAGSDEVNLDYAKKATDLTLEFLQDQLAKGKVDDGLRRRLGWSEEEFQSLLKRMQAMRDRGADAQARPEDKLAYEQWLKSLGLRPASGAIRTGRPETKALDRSRDDAQINVPRDLREQHEAFRRGLLEKVP